MVSGFFMEFQRRSALIFGQLPAAEHGPGIQIDHGFQLCGVSLVKALPHRLAERPHGAIATPEAKLLQQQRRIRENRRNRIVPVFREEFLLPAFEQHSAPEHQKQDQQKQQPYDQQDAPQDGLRNGDHAAAVGFRFLHFLALGLFQLLPLLGCRAQTVSVCPLGVFRSEALIVLGFCLIVILSIEGQVQRNPADTVLIHLNPGPGAVAVHHNG